MIVFVAYQKNILEVKCIMYMFYVYKMYILDPLAKGWIIYCFYNDVCVFLSMSEDIFLKKKNLQHGNIGIF